MTFYYLYKRKQYLFHLLNYLYVVVLKVPHAHRQKYMLSRSIAQLYQSLTIDHFYRLKRTASTRRRPGITRDRPVFE